MSDNDRFLCVSNDDLEWVSYRLKSMSELITKFLGYGLPSEFSLKAIGLIGESRDRITKIIDKGKIMSVEIENNGVVIRLSQKEIRDLFSSLGKANEILRSHIAIANGSSSNSYAKGVESIHKIAAILDRKKEDKGECDEH